jgi:hypothetical protein
MTDRGTFTTSYRAFTVDTYVEPVLRLERHRLGPRVYLFGLRIHEFALGFAVLAILIAGGVAEAWDLTRRTEFAALFGTFLIGKDWRDLFPSKRNTAAWSLLPHRVPRD